MNAHSLKVAHGVIRQSVLVETCCFLFFLFLDIILAYCVAVFWHTWLLWVLLAASVALILHMGAYSLQTKGITLHALPDRYSELFARLTQGKRLRCPLLYMYRANYFVDVFTARLSSKTFIAFEERLLAKFDDEQLGALLFHEMTHYKWRDCEATLLWLCGCVFYVLASIFLLYSAFQYSKLFAVALALIFIAGGLLLHCLSRLVILHGEMRADAGSSIEAGSSFPMTSALSLFQKTKDLERRIRTLHSCREW